RTIRRGFAPIPAARDTPPARQQLAQAPTQAPAQVVDQPAQNVAEVPAQAVEPQRSKSSQEWQMRSRSVQQASSYNFSNAYNQRDETANEGGDEPATIDPPVVANTQADGAKALAKNDAERRRAKPLVLGNVREGPMFPLWLGDALVVARRVEVDGAAYVQGAWLDWSALEAQLLTDVADLVPKARLAKATGPLDPATGATRRLASLPAELVALEITGPTDTPAELGVGALLVIAWGAVLVAAAAVGVLFAGTIALSERRGAFVSAVTHELRTPLTTFRMYSEMLAEGMIDDPAKRQRYVETLRREAVRLTHLVENVLAYARIERGRATGRIEVLALGDVLPRITERLRDRAAQAEMELVTDLAAVADHGVVADATALEQILFNLVDNACKYARAAQDRRIELTTDRAGPRVHLVVRDHGPGIPADERRRLFSPFSKSAQRAATSAPGVGLGLALSRRLARTMKGDLVYAPPSDGGAAFRLELPAGAPRG
ncbi:ATP-binding protein, partial [Myxococcota bacterium]|nr:ATP-binding protein [Myxococcota bacterium]